MTLQEILRAKGMADDAIEGVLGDMKTHKIFTTSHENMDVRYPKLKGEHDTLVSQHDEAVKLIEGFKADAQNNEALQGKITGYEATIADLTKKLEDQKIEAAMDRKLTAAGAKPEDLDYLRFQMRKKGDLALDDNGEIKGGDEIIDGLKTQCPAQFVSEANKLEIQPHELPGRKEDGGGTVTKADFEKMGYESRVKLKESNPELYTQLTKG